MRCSPCFAWQLAATRREAGNAAQGIIPVPSPCDIAIEELIADYDTIRLEVTDEAILSDINFLHIMNNKLYIVDTPPFNIFIYSLEGKYLGKISDQGEGPEEYIRIGRFETAPANNRLLVTDSFSQRLFEYDENGKLTSVLPLAFPPNQIASDKSGRFIHLNSTMREEYTCADAQNTNVQIIGPQGDITDAFLPDETPKRLDIVTHTLGYADNGELLYMPVFSDTIYRIHHTEAIPEYILQNLSSRKSLTAKDKKEMYHQYQRSNLEAYEKDGYLVPYGWSCIPTACSA